MRNLYEVNNLIINLTYVKDYSSGYWACSSWGVMEVVKRRIYKIVSVN